MCCCTAKTVDRRYSSNASHKFPIETEPHKRALALPLPYTENHNVCHAGVSICVCYRVTTVSDIHKPMMWMCVHSRGGAKRWALSLITRNLQFGRHQWCTLGIALKIPDKLKLLRLRATYVCVCVFFSVIIVLMVYGLQTNHILYFPTTQAFRTWTQLCRPDQTWWTSSGVCSVDGQPENGI